MFIRYSTDKQKSGMRLILHSCEIYLTKRVVSQVAVQWRLPYQPLLGFLTKHSRNSSPIQRDLICSRMMEHAHTVVLTDITEPVKCCDITFGILLIAVHTHRLTVFSQNHTRHRAVLPLGDRGSEHTCVHKHHLNRLLDVKFVSGTDN